MLTPSHHHISVLGLLVKDAGRPGKKFLHTYLGNGEPRIAKSTYRNQYVDMTIVALIIGLSAGFRGGVLWLMLAPTLLMLSTLPLDLLGSHVTLAVFAFSVLVLCVTFSLACGLRLAGHAGRRTSELAD